MGVLYIIMALIVMVLNAGMLPEVLRRIFVGAFDFKAIFGGAAGFGSSALMQGIKRGLYSNEAGVGSAPNAAAAADVSHPVKQGLVQMLSVFIDTILALSRASRSRALPSYRPRSSRPSVRQGRISSPSLCCCLRSRHCSATCSTARAA